MKSEDTPCVFNVAEVFNALYGIYSTSDKIKLNSWFKTPPGFTTVRVNYPENLDVAFKELQNIVDNNFKSRNITPQAVYAHRIMKDLLVIPSVNSNNINECAEKEIIVDVHCGAAVLRGADIFAPGVIGAPGGLRVNDYVSVYADLEGKCLKGCVKNYTGAKMFLGTGKAMHSRHDLFNNNIKVSGVAILMLETSVNFPSLGDNILGSKMFLQNLPSVVCGHVLDPKPTDFVLDMCASPGGKTTHLASLMKNSGVIVALDKTKPRVAKLQTNINLTGYTNIHAFVFDATKALDEKPEDSSTRDMIRCPPYPADTFDCILLDAPCSALGQRPQLSNKITMKELQAYPHLQRKLLSVAVQLLKPNGKLVYSTCSLTLEENEKLVAWTLEKYPCLKLDEQNPMIGGPGLEIHGLTESDSKKLQRFDINSPGTMEDSDTIGFFIAKFKKKPETK